MQRINWGTPQYDPRFAGRDGPYVPNDSAGVPRHAHILTFILTWVLVSSGTSQGPSEDEEVQCQEDAKAIVGAVGGYFTAGCRGFCSGAQGG